MSWWKPEGVLTWQWQLSGALELNLPVQVYDIDAENATPMQVAYLRAKGVKVIGYFDTSFEPGRIDSATLAPYRCGPYDGWDGQFWLDFRNPVVREVTVERLKRIKLKGFDAVEADSVDAISNNPGCRPALTPNDQLEYIKFVAEEAHKLGMAFGLKNNTAQCAALEPWYDFIVAESALNFLNNDGTGPELKDYRAGAKAKPIFLCQYVPTVSTRRGKYTANALAKLKLWQPQADQYRASLIVKEQNLGKARLARSGG